MRTIKENTPEVTRAATKQYFESLYYESEPHEYMALKSLSNIMETIDDYQAYLGYK